MESKLLHIIDPSGYIGISSFSAGQAVLGVLLAYATVSTLDIILIVQQPIGMTMTIGIGRVI